MTTPDSTTTRSRALFERAQRVLAGGVNSPARAYRSVGGTPRFMTRGRGARIWDEDGREYIDYVCAWGPLLFGHAHQPVVDAVSIAARDGVCLGTPTSREVEYAELVARLTGWVEVVRVMNSGSEATATAARLARATTGRSKVVRFEGGYHGHGDAFLGDAAAREHHPPSGVPADVAAQTLVASYNDLSGVQRLLEARGPDIAAVFVEPVAANMGVVAPRPGFLSGLRASCTACGAVLVFDEVVTGFRLAAGGAIERYGVRPDLVVYGKVAGGGLPFGAVGGPRSIMSRLAPSGDVFHAGTFAGNPLTMAAGLAQLGAIASDSAVYARLDALGAALEAGVVAALRAHRHPCWFARVGSMWTLFFCEGPVVDWASASRADTPRFAKFFHALLAHGISTAPSQFEANFISAAHTASDIEHTVTAMVAALRESFATTM